METQTTSNTLLLGTESLFQQQHKEEPTSNLRHQLNDLMFGSVSIYSYNKVKY
jgi:hypothetical protein